MPALSLSVFVSPRAAIVAGRTSIGVQTLNVPEAELKELPEALRFELALAYETGKPLGEDQSEPPIVEATIAGIRPVLEARASRRAKLDEAQKIADARAAEIALVAAREATANDNARARALRKWVETRGDDEQKARMAEGFLPEDEILDEICAEVLDLPGFRIYDKLRRGDACDCACAHQVDFQEGPPLYMDAHQFARLQAAREAAPEGAKVEVIQHRAACSACRCAPIARLEARITLPWSGWLLVRQYALT